VRDEEASMKRSKFTEAQIAFLLKQVARSKSLSEACHRAGNFGATLCNWRKKYGGLMP
jgi:putative transposase